MDHPLNQAKKIRRADLKAALKAAAGIPAAAAERLGCSRQNVIQRIKGDAELEAWVAEIEQTITDQAQANVVLAMQEREPRTNKPTKEAQRTSRWWLERIGKGRGFTTRAELTGPDGKALQIAPPNVQVNVTYVEGSGEDVV